MVTGIATSFTSPVDRMSYGAVLFASTALPTGTSSDSATHMGRANDFLFDRYSLTETRQNMLPPFETFPRCLRPERPCGRLVHPIGKRLSRE